MNNKIFLSILLGLFLITFISAESMGYGKEGQTVNYGANYSINVNSSEYWVTDEGILNNVADILISWISASDLDLLGYTISTNFLQGVVGMLSMDGDPWYLAGTDLEIAENLIVDGDVTINGTLLPSETLAGDIGSGANRWANLWVSNISAEHIDSFTGYFSDNLTVDGYINGVNISNLSSQYVPYTGAIDNLNIGSYNITTESNLIISNGTTSTTHWNMYEDGNGTLVWEKL